MKESILSAERRCLVCGAIENLKRHTIVFHPGARETSEREGCWCWLCTRHNNMVHSGIRTNHILEQRLRENCQKVWERKFGGRDSFVKTFGMSYI